MNSRHYSRFISVFVAVSTLAIIISATLSFAQQGPPSIEVLPPAKVPLEPSLPTKPSSPVVREVPLTPLPSAEVLIPDFKAQFNADGSVTLSIRGTYPINGPPFAFSYEVDPKSGTYTTKRLDPSQLQLPPPQEEHFKVNPSPSPPSGEPQGSLWQWLTPSEAYAATTYWASVRLMTTDIIGCALTDTYTSLNWTVNDWGGICWNWIYDSCWAANPSCANTHWFTDGCWFGGVWYSAYGEVCHDHAGAYHNYDFGYDDQRTDVYQYVGMCGGNGYFNYWVNHSDSGEASTAIWGVVAINT